jgi:hypothetical protein
MRNYSRGLIQLTLVFVFVIVLIRFFPIVIRAADAAALGIMAFWRIILIFALAILVIWALKRKRN